MTNLIQKIRSSNFDWDFLKGSATVSIGSAFAQVLGLAFFIVLAEAFPAEDYGQIQYFISVSAVVAVITQPFGQHTIARYVGKHKDDPAELRIILSNAFVIMLALFALTLIVSIPIILGMDRSNLAILVIFFGTTIFYTYWGLTRGFLQAKNLTLAYILSNLVQILVVVFVVYVLKNPSITTILLIYGLSYLIPLALLQIFSPLPIRISLSEISLKKMWEILRFSGPIWVSHLSYITLVQIDILLIENFVSLDELGAYALTRTLTSVFVFIPNGISTLLMPRFASGESAGGLRLLTRMLVLSTVGNLLVFIVYVFSIQWATRTFFGESYMVELIVSVIYALAVIAGGIYRILVAFAVGINRAGAESAGRLFAIVVLFGFGLWLIPTQGVYGAAITKLVALVGAILVSLYLLRDVLTDKKWRMSSESNVAGTD